MLHRVRSFFFFFNDTATTEIYTLSLHDALPISTAACQCSSTGRPLIHCSTWARGQAAFQADRKSTRLNSSHQIISYAVFCLKKKYIANSTASYSLIDTISASHIISVPSSMHNGT